MNAQSASDQPAGLLPLNGPLVVGVTGASGAAYARRLLETLSQGPRTVHVCISPSGQAVLRHELHWEGSLDRFDPRGLGLETEAAFARGQFVYHHHRDMLAPIASGSHRTAGMVICPCSGGTLSGVAHGASDNLIKRAADVHLKERRRLVLVPRETPLSRIHLENMQRAHDAGAVILPASPGWYQAPQRLEDLIDFVVARILDQLQVPHQLGGRWGDCADETSSEAPGEPADAPTPGASW